MQRAISPKLFYGASLAVLAVFVLLITFFSSYIRAEAARDFTVPTHQAGRLDYFTFFSATTTTATSTNTSDGGGAFMIAGAKNVNLFFSRGATAGPNAGSTIFKIQISPDGSTWYDYNALMATAVTAGAVDRPLVGTSSIAAATSTTIFKMADLGYYAIRCIAVETTDGEHTCKAEAEF